MFLINKLRWFIFPYHFFLNFDFFAGSAKKPIISLKRVFVTKTVGYKSIIKTPPLTTNTPPVPTTSPRIRKIPISSKGYNVDLSGSRQKLHHCDGSATSCNQKSPLRPSLQPFPIKR